MTCNRFMRFVFVCALLTGSLGFGALNSAFAAAPALKSVSVSGSVTGGGDMTIKVTFTGNVTVNTAVSLKSNRPSVVTPPSTITVIKGHATATITTATRAANQVASVTITAKSGGITKTDIVVVKPPALSNVSLPTSGKVGIGINLTVRLNSIAPAGGMNVQLSSGNTDVLVVPTTAHVPGGASGVAIRVTPILFGTVTVAGTLNGVTKTDSLTVIAAATSTQIPTLTNTPGGPPATATPTGSATNTPIPPTATQTKTSTPIPPTNTVAPTSSPTPNGPTATPTLVAGVVLQDFHVDGIDTSLGLLISQGWTISTVVRLQNPAPATITLNLWPEWCLGCYPDLAVSLPATVTVQAGATQSDPFNVLYDGEGGGVLHADYGSNHATMSFLVRNGWPYNAFQTDATLLVPGQTVHITVQVDSVGPPDGATVTLVKVSGTCGFTSTTGTIAPLALTGTIDVTGVQAGNCVVNYVVAGTRFSDHYLARTLTVYPPPTPTP